MLEPKNKYSSQVKKKNWKRNIEPQKESIPQYTAHITHVFAYNLLVKSTITIIWNILDID
jgi:hypothetical protein